MPHGTHLLYRLINNNPVKSYESEKRSYMRQTTTNLCISSGIDKYFVCYRDTGEKARLSERTDKALTVPEYYKEWDRRKPGPGMLIEAMEHFGIDRQDTLMIGDREEDRLAAEAAGVDFIFTWDYFGDGPIIV